MIRPGWKNKSYDRCPPLFAVQQKIVFPSHRSNKSKQIEKVKQQYSVLQHIPATRQHVTSALSDPCVSWCQYETSIDTESRLPPKGEKSLALSLLHKQHLANRISRAMMRAGMGAAFQTPRLPQSSPICSSLTAPVKVERRTHQASCCQTFP